MDPYEARVALAESDRRREQTIEAGTAPWPWRLVLIVAASFVALGLSQDVEMVWLGGAVIGAVAAAWTSRAVKLRETRRSRGWVTALLATFVLALLADIAVQFAVRGADLPLPNTLGAVGAAMVVIFVCRPVHARTAASLRP